MSFPHDLLSNLAIPNAITPINNTDLLDYAGSNTIQSARYINPQTQDFQVSSTNHLLGQNAVDQEVLLAMNTTFNSSVQIGFGQNFGSIKVINTNMQNQVQTILNQALANLINNQSITLGDVLISNNGLGQLSIQFDYTNNTTNTTVPLTFTTGSGK